MSRFRSKVSVTLELPVPLRDVISSTPAIVVNCRSSGLATDAAMITGIAAGQIRRDVDRRILDGRQIADRQRAVRDDAEQRDRRHQQAGGDRPPDEGFGDVHGGRLLSSTQGLLPTADPASSSACHSSPPLRRRRALRACRRVRRWDRPPGLSCPAPDASWPSVTIVSPTFKPLSMTTISPMRCADGHRPLFHRGVCLDDEHELAVLPDLHGLTRNDRRVRERREPQAHARELARPQPEILVRERRLQLDRVGRACRRGCRRT